MVRSRPQTSDYFIRSDLHGEVTEGVRRFIILSDHTCLRTLTSNAHRSSQEAVVLVKF